MLLKLDEDVVESRFAIATGPSFENRAKSLTEGHGNTRLDSIGGRRRRCTNAAWSNCGLGADKQAFCNVLSKQYKNTKRYSVSRQYPSLSSIQSVLAGNAYDPTDGSDVAHCKVNRRMRKADHGVVIELYVRKRAGRSECLGRQLE